MQLAVLLKGMLRGMGREAACEIMAKRRDIPHSNKYLYSDLRFIAAPADLPQGDYVATFEPFTIAVKHRHGDWLIGQELTPYSGQLSGSGHEAQRAQLAPLRALRLAPEEPEPQE